MQSTGVLDYCPRTDRGRNRSIVAWLLYHGARWAQRRSSLHTPADRNRTTDEENYRVWRRSELQCQLVEYFETASIAGRDVLDFGCGTGELCTLLRSYAPKSLLGIDKSDDAITRAAATTSTATAHESCQPRFLCNERHGCLPIGTDSVDLICCFDVLEHIPDIRAIAGEWRRVLRSRGRVWIWWSPWRGPYGHHIESLMPLPWVHLLFPPRAIFEACARLYDDPDFVPRKWDVDPATGKKKPNKWRNTQSFYPFLNRLTRGRFERVVREAGLIITRHETLGFSGSAARKATRVLLPVPQIGECFASFCIYELMKR